MTRCTTCIIPADYPGVTFDKDGRCSFCTTYEPSAQTKSKEALVELLRSRKTQGPYDCVVPVSGGKDSLYVLYCAVRKLGLKAIAVHYDNCFVHEIAKRNIVTACEKLNVPLVIRKAPRNVHKQLVREALVMSEICGSYLRCFCADCGLLHRASALSVARQYNVPWMLWGNTTVESAKAHELAMLGGRRTRWTRLRRLFQRMKELHLGPLKVLRMLPHVATFYLLKLYRRWSMGIPLRGVYKGLEKIQDGPTLVRFYDYVDWDVNEEANVLTEELGWQHPPDKESRFDCLLHSFSNARYLESNRISLDGTMLCNFVREGKTSREDALRKEQQVRETVEAECQVVIDQFDLPDYQQPKF